MASSVERKKRRRSRREWKPTAGMRGGRTMGEGVVEGEEEEGGVMTQRVCGLNGERESLSSLEEVERGLNVRGNGGVVGS